MPCFNRYLAPGRPPTRSGFGNRPRGLIEDYCDDFVRPVHWFCATFCCFHRPPCCYNQGEQVHRGRADPTPSDKGCRSPARPHIHTRDKRETNRESCSEQTRGSVGQAGVSRTVRSTYNNANAKTRTKPRKAAALRAHSYENPPALSSPCTPNKTRQGSFFAAITLTATNRRCVASAV